MFDPEKVERYFRSEEQDEKMVADSVFGNYVKGYDYNKLLEIHLHHVGMIADLFKRCGEPLPEDAIAKLKNGTWR
jgi:hypothetical protein